MAEEQGGAMQIFERIARLSRPAGSSAEAEARALCRDFCQSHGFTCVEREFEYSTFPGRWATPLIGSILFVGALSIIAGQLLLLNPGASVVFVVAVLSITAVIGWLTFRYGTVSFPFFKSKSINLEAHRTGAEGSIVNVHQSVVLVAHLDSKSQPVSMLARVSAVFVSIISWSGLIVFSLVQFFEAGHVDSAWNPIVMFATMAAVASLGLMFCIVEDKGTGALDNASGVATVLQVVERLDRDLPLSILFTSAEELGLAGARAYMERITKLKTGIRGYMGVSDGGSLSDTLVINCDSIDDAGDIQCMMPTATEKVLRPILEHAGNTSKVPVNVRRLIPGILVDSLIFSKVGLNSLTVSRGTWKTLQRIHTSDDNLQFITGEGIESSANYIIELVKASLMWDPAQLAGDTVK